jgi:protein-S-isoprenylcysteine O-methyltransferase Ste14
MKTSTAAVGSAMFFVVAPGTVGGLVPWLITGWRVHWSWTAPHIIAVVLIGLGLIPVVSAFVEFAKAGGTPLPAAAPHRLVVSGFNRYVRNPMYVGILLAVLGQALLFHSLGLVVYAAVVWAATAAFVRWYEEPTLSGKFGTDYQAYREAVPAWWPRVSPWTAGLS